jgi:hypothetical protein
MFGKRLTALTVLAGALLLGGSTVRADGEPRHCAQKNTRDVAADARGRIYVVGRRDPTPWYACLRSHNVPILIAEADDPNTEVSVPRVASPYAAAAIHRLSSYSYVEELQVIDMRRGKVKSTFVGGGVYELVLTPRGVAVYVNAPTDDRPVRVWRMDRQGTVVQLDEGNIALGSLALSQDERRVYWVKDDVPQSAAL